MRKEVIKENQRCPARGKDEGQRKNGHNKSGTQTYICKWCRKIYTPEPKRHAYDEETKELAIKMYYSGVSGRGVGKVLKMNKANVYNWIKKTK